MYASQATHRHQQAAARYDQLNVLSDENRPLSKVDRGSVDLSSKMIVDLDCVLERFPTKDFWEVHKVLEILVEQGQYHGCETVARIINDMLIKHKDLLFNTPEAIKHQATALDLLYEINNNLTFCRYMELAYLLAKVERFSTPASNKQFHSVRVAMKALSDLFPLEYKHLEEYKYQNIKFVRGVPMGREELQKMMDAWKEPSFVQDREKAYEEKNLEKLHATVISITLENFEKHPTPNHPAYKLKALQKKSETKKFNSHVDKDHSGSSSPGPSGANPIAHGSVFNRFMNALSPIFHHYRPLDSSQSSLDSLSISKPSSQSSLDSLSISKPSSQSSLDSLSISKPSSQSSLDSLSISKPSSQSSLDSLSISTQSSQSNLDSLSISQKTTSDSQSSLDTFVLSKPSTPSSKDSGGGFSGEKQIVAKERKK